MGVIEVPKGNKSSQEPTSTGQEVLAPISDTAGAAHPDLAQLAANNLVAGGGKGLAAFNNSVADTKTNTYESDDVGTRFLDGKMLAALPVLVERARVAQKAENSDELQSIGEAMFKLFSIPIDEGTVFRKFESKAAEAVWYFDTPLPIVEGRIRTGHMSKYVSIPVPVTVPEPEKPDDSQIVVAQN